MALEFLRGDAALAYEVSGRGTPIVFCHEFAQNHEGWAPQVSRLAPLYRTICYSRVGYPPSDVSDKPDAYGFATSVADLGRVVAGVAGSPAHLVGHGAGGNIALDYTLANPHAVRSLTLIGSGAGSDNPRGWTEAARDFAARMDQGREGLVSGIATAPQRQVFRQRDPAGWERFVAALGRLSHQGCARAMRGALSRPSFMELKDQLASLRVPILLILGDQDRPSFEGTIFVLRTAPQASLAVLPLCGHTENLESSDLLNQILSGFLMRVEAGRLPAP
ncbi:alpha/beta fold hydrolase [Enterovirga sp. CN4-39]|uniref:alpha/beta fold hydrolase n=1 Tax=Enterovirga sp. CN4-39 TaxID=3400910 RepID=UPI003C03ABEA